MMKKFRTSIIAAAVALCAAPAAMAVPAYPGLITVTQEDGTELEVRLRGDEHGHFYTTADNYLIVRDNGVFYYAVPGTADTPLVSSGIRATAAVERTAAVRSFLNSVDTDAALAMFSDKRAKIAEQAVAVRNEAMASRAESRAEGIPAGKEMLISDVPTLGNLKVCVLLVEFKDVKFSKKYDDPARFFKRYMMEKGFNEYGMPGSVNDYFVNSSQGKFNPQFDVYGPVTLKNEVGHYGRNLSGMGTDAHPEEMLMEALDALDPTVDFSVYDTDNDGKIDNFTIIYAGEGEATSGQAKLVWPHAAYAYSGMGVERHVDGKLVDHYNCLNEWVRSYNRPAGPGTFIHEFSHILGLTDQYDTDYLLAADQTVTPGRWSVMDNGPYNGGGLVPPLHSAFERYSLGWMDLKEITGPCDLWMDAANRGAFYIRTDEPNEFFVFENRWRQENAWDAELPGDGMLVWHIDYNRRAWDRNITNNNKDHLRIKLVNADNDPLPETDSRDAFPGRTGAFPEFTAETSPAFLAWSGYDPGLPFTKIKMDRQGHLSAKVAGGGETIGIESIGTDNASAPVEWFTLQGVRVSQPTAGNIYIRRQGTDIAKQLYR